MSILMHDEEPLTECCGASFIHPDSDLCSACYEHADVSEEDKKEEAH